MDNLVNYGSDEDSDNSSKYHQGLPGARRMHSGSHGGSGDHARPPNQQRGADDGTNYDPVQMDLSEEDEPSSKNSTGQKPQQSPERERDRANRQQNRNSSHNDTNFKRDRDNRNSRDSKDHNDDRDRDHRNRRDDDRDKERDRERINNRDDRNRPWFRGGRDDKKDNRGADRDKRGNSTDRDRDNRDNIRRDNRDGVRDNRDKIDNRRDRDRNTSSNNRDRDNYSNRDIRDNRDRDRDNRDNRQREDRDNRRRGRSPVNQQNFNNYRGGAATRRFDRASNKMAQLEKLGIEIKAPDNFVPPVSGIYTPDNARGNNLGNCNSGLGGNQAGMGGATGNAAGGGADGQFFMPGVTGRFRDQIERRKQLWAKSKHPSDLATPTQVPTTVPQQQHQQHQPPIAGSATWAATTFAQDTDGRQASKFKRLMGIRGNEAGGTNSEGSTTNKRQEEMFNSMEAQYEVARTATHTMRGVGLGFSSATQGLFPR